MSNLEPSNSTPGKVQAAPVVDKDGREFLAVILKYTFAIDPLGRVTLLAEEAAADVDLVDTYNGEEPGKASIRRPSQLFEAKPGTDVVLIGRAHPPRAEEVSSVDVTLTFGPIRKTVRAHGFRVWQRGLMGGISAGPARPIREPDTPEPLLGTRRGIHSRQARQPAGQLQVLESVQVVVEVRLLGQEPQSPAARRVGDRLVEQPARAAGRLEQTGEQLQGRGLARAVRPEHAHDLARLDLEAEVDQTGDAAQ